VTRLPSYNSLRMTTCPYCASSLQAASATCPTCGASLTSPALEIGAVIGGKYRIERVLGQGGFGITYLALDTALDYCVAIKELFVDGSTRSGVNVLPPIGIDFAQTKQKFLEEAQTVQRFNVAGIVRVYGVFEGNQTAYMVMEALSGATLTADIAENGAFPAKTVLELARQLCASLEIVHEADLLHRDIKPDNVFLSSDGRVVLIDFGSARGFAQGAVKRLTRLVTPGYAAPEQYASQAAFGTYTDVYGLAATLYYAVEGQMPPMATDLMLGARLEFKHAGQLQAGLEAGLRVKVDERPQTVRDLLELLERPVVARVAAAAPIIFFNQKEVAVSAREIVLRGRIVQASALDGFYIVEQVSKKLPNEKLRLLAQVGNYLYAVGLLGFIPSIFFSIYKSNFAFLTVISVLAFLASFIISSILRFYFVEDFSARFVVVFGGRQIQQLRELTLLVTSVRIEATQLEQALLKVIPKIP
jgi:serine/threonine protein kinase